MFHCEVDELMEKIEGKLKIFFEEELTVPLDMFDSVLKNILRIDRVHKISLEHLLLVGSSEVSKTTLSPFIAWMNNLTVFKIKADRKYSVNNFDDDLRGIIKRAPAKVRKFIFNESNLLKPAFLEKNEYITSKW